MTNIRKIYADSRVCETHDLFGGPVGSDGHTPLRPSVSPTDSVIISGLPSIINDMSLAEVGMMHVLSKCPGISKEGAFSYATQKGLSEHAFDRVWGIHEATLSLAARPRKNGAKAKPKIPQVGLGEVVIERLVAKDGTMIAIMDDFVDSMASTYPGVDIEYELKRAARWLDVNPAKRKTLQGIGRFINTWMRNCHDRLQMKQTIMATEKETSSPFGVRSTRDSDAQARPSFANTHLDALIG